MEKYAKDLHKLVFRPAEFRQVISNGIDDIWGADTLSMQWTEEGDFAGKNDGFKFISVWMDIFTRFLWCVPLKTTQAAETLRAFQSILAMSGRTPHKIWVDRGGEFKASFAKYAKDHGMEIYHSNGTHKVSIVERMNRTLGHEIWLHFDQFQTRRWVDALPAIVAKINARKSRSLGMSPDAASELSERGLQSLWTRQYGQVEENIDPKLEVGDWVRLARTKTAFEKASTQNWTSEPFQIVEVKLGHPPQYRVQDLLGEPIEGWAYEAEVQFLSHTRPTEFLIEKVLKTRTRNGVKESLVKWVGLDDRFNSWQPASSITRTFD